MTNKHGDLSRLRIDLASGPVESRTFSAGSANEFPRLGAFNPA